MDKFIPMPVAPRVPPKVTGQLARLATSVLAATLLAACGPKEPVRIGFIGELTGNSADLGEAGRNGALLAVETINQAGGIAGRQVELLTRDTGSTPEAAKAAASELLGKGVVAVIGPMTSGMAKAILPAHDAARIVLVSPTATAMTLHGQDDYLFRINWTTRDNAMLYAKHCHERGFRRLALAANQNNRAFSESWANEFQRAFEQHGGQIVGIEYFDSAAESQLPVVEKLLAPRPDALVFVANAGDTARLAQQTRKLDQAVPLVAAEWASTGQLLEQGGQAVEGLAIVQQFNADDPSPHFTDFHQRYTKRFGRAPAFASVLAHDAATVLFDALGRRDGDTPLKRTLVDKGPFQGLQQTIRFDANGDTQRSAAIALVRDGRFVRQAP